MLNPKQIPITKIQMLKTLSHFLAFSLFHFSTFLQFLIPNLKGFIGSNLLRHSTPEGSTTIFNLSFLIFNFYNPPYFPPFKRGEYKGALTSVFWIPASAGMTYRTGMTFFLSSVLFPLSSFWQTKDLQLHFHFSFVILFLKHYTPV